MATSMQETDTAPVTPQKTNEQTEQQKEIKIDFQCYNCNMSEQCNYFGKNPPFANKIYFTEETFVMKDPFSPPSSSIAQSSSSSHKLTNSEQFIVLGANCALCKQTICQGVECSYFYLKTICLNCAIKNINKYPLEIRSKIKRQFANLNIK